MKIIASFFLTLFVTANAISQTNALKKNKVNIYVLAGQSNMAGRGTLEAIDTIINSNIWKFDKEENWVPAKEPLHFDKPKVVGVGPGFAFANEIWKADTSVTVYLVPCAVGGTKIDLWTPGAFDSTTQTHPYDDAINRIRKAMTFGEIRGIVWHQGESDCNPLMSSGYEEKLRALIKRFRTDLQKPALPFILGEIAHFRVEENKDKIIVNRAIKEVAKTIPNCNFVQTNGLHHRGDTLHFDSPSAREIGKRYAAAMLSIQK